MAESIIDFTRAAPGRAWDWASKAGTATIGKAIKRFGDADENLLTARGIYEKGSNGVVKSLVFRVTRRTLMAIGQEDIAQALLIWKGIFTNHINQDTLAFILEHKSDLIKFFVDLAEPAKLYAASDSTNGTASNVQGPNNPYNELDLTRPMNRHAAICQFQRLVKSLANIMAMGRDSVPLNLMNMDTRLASDFNAAGNEVDVAPLTITFPEENTNENEKWLFVNGVAGEYFWLRLYCERLRDRFQRDITGIFNRGDGIFWDVVECAGQRDLAGGQQGLIQRTRSSREAQNRLETELSTALELSPTFDEEKRNYIVMVAYSQGCLLLRHVLQGFVETNAHMAAMRSRLRVFTFGNPSIDWMVMDAAGHSVRLSQYVNHTEHFANERDFVAKLGVVRGYQSPDTGFMNHQRSWTFINDRPEWIGHLFGTQYSLRAEHYRNANNSKLLSCGGGAPMAP